MGLMFVTLIGTGSLSSVNDLQSAQALYIAEGGLENATLLLNTSTLANRIACANVNANLNVKNLGQGQFTVTVPNGSNNPFYSLNAVTLTAAIAPGSTVIPVGPLANLGNYDLSGRVVIDREAIDYGGQGTTVAECNPVAPPCLTSAVRARDGTVATSHANGARLGQYQCSITSTGGVPDLTTPAAQRAIREGIQLQEGWAVGNNGVILRWAGTSWVLFATTGTRLRSVSIDSYANGWTVGDLWPQAGTDYAQIRRWNPDGTPAWDLVNAPAEATVRLNAVHTLSHNEAWAVGNRVGGGTDSLIIRWGGGPNWVYTDPSGNIDINLNSLYMFDVNNDGSADDGWAVGVSNGTRPIVLRWNTPCGGGVGTGLWNDCTNAAYIPAIDENLNSVFLVASNDGWAVGTAGAVATQRPLILWWNGAAWATRNSNLNINTPLNSIYCVATDDCWAVGDASGGEVILHWDGLAWTRVGPSGAIPNVDLNSVQCVDTEDCWAVGNNGVILHWDGTAWAQAASPVAQALLSVYVIGPRQRPQAAWQEVVQ